MRLLIILLLPLINNCFLLTRGARNLDQIYLLIFGILLLIVGVKTFMNKIGRKEINPIKRFTFGLLTGISIFLG